MTRYNSGHIVRTFERGFSGLRGHGITWSGDTVCVLGHAGVVVDTAITGGKAGWDRSFRSSFFANIIFFTFFER